jgi:hypothetical protein
LSTGEPPLQLGHLPSRLTWREHICVVAQRRSRDECADTTAVPDRIAFTTGMMASITAKLTIVMAARLIALPFSCIHRLLNLCCVSDLNLRAVRCA